MKSHIFIMGAGAIGSVFGGLLVKAGHEVVLVGRKSHMDAIRKNGLRITGLLGNHHVKNLKCYTDIAAVKKKMNPTPLQAAGYSAKQIKTPFDFILLTVKAYDTENAAKIIKPLVKKHTQVISLQNGITNIDAITKHIPVQNFIAGRVIFGVTMKKPGHVHVTVWGDDVALGKIRAPRADIKVSQTAQMFTGAGIRTKASPVIEQIIWTKALYNCALNPLGALLNAPYGKLAEMPETRALIAEMLKEIYKVLKAKKVNLPRKTADAYLNHLWNTLIPPTAAHEPSMLYDLKKKKRTEIDALNGAVVEYGGEKGIALPFNEVLSRIVKFREAKNV